MCIQDILDIPAAQPDSKESSSTHKALDTISRPDDLVAVVRCRDCKYNSCSPDHGNACCDYFYGMTDQMGFCNYGERRTDENNNE